MKKEFFMLVRAGLRQRKKLFIGEFLIMLIVIAVVSSCLSCKYGIDRGVEEADALDVQFDEYWITDEALIPSDGIAALSTDPCVGNVTVIHSLIVFNEEYYTGLVHPATDETAFMNDDCSAVKDEKTEVEQGTVYISQGYYRYKKGDTIKLCLNYNESTWHEYTVAGYILDTVLGSYGMGTRHVIVSDADMALLEEEADAAVAARLEKGDEDWNKLICFSEIFVLQADDSGMSETEFMRYMNENHAFLNESLFTQSRSNSDYYIVLIVEIVMAVMLVVSAILLLILLVITAHNISSGMRLDYTDIGILRANGAGRSLPVRVICAEHLLVLVLGAAFGLALSIPLAYVLSGPFQIFTAIPAAPYIVWKLILPIVLLVLLVSALIIIICSRKVSSVSSLSAINGGMQDVYFSGKARGRISGRMLHFTLALRQLRSGLSHYIGIAVISVMLTLLLLLIGTIDSSLGSRRAMESMGVIVRDFAFKFNDENKAELTEKADAIVAEYSGFSHISYSNCYAYVNGENCRWDYYNDGYTILVHEGRAPKHENEIAISEIMANYLGVKIGDEVSLAYGDVTLTCTVTGYSQTLYDMGKGIAMNLRTAEKFGLTVGRGVYYTLEDTTYKTEAYDEVLETLGDSVEDSIIFDEISALDDYMGIVKIIEIVLYITCALICLISVSMNCSKLLTVEKRDLGIYRSMGFSVTGLRLQFAFRFLLASSAGTLLGLGLNFLLSEKLIALLLRSVGFSYFVSDYSVMGIILPLLLIWLLFFAFAFLESRKIKSIEIRELVTE